MLSFCIIAGIYEKHMTPEQIVKEKINIAAKSKLVMHAACLFVLFVLPAPVYFPTKVMNNAFTLFAACIN